MGYRHPQVYASVDTASARRSTIFIRIDEERPSPDANGSSNASTSRLAR